MGAALKMMERRTLRRLPIRVLIEYELLEDFLHDYTANISVGGMFIQTDKPLDIGTRFRLRFQVPGRKRPIETYAEVRWSIPSETAGPMSPGMGVQFDALSPGDARCVREMIGEFEAGPQLV
ncbi:MAG TPA: TIGR02266 family protein [Myxococcota bacterium]|nr:TIGR02266 family protein [Myxococcota bacterium]